jgi:hypothetical protein
MIKPNTAKQALLAKERLRCLAWQEDEDAD